MKIRAIVKPANDQIGQMMEIRNDLKTLQSIVGGYIEAVPVGDGVVVICDEEGRLKGKPYNCTINGISFVGTIILCGDGEEDFTDYPL